MRRPLRRYTNAAAALALATTTVLCLACGGGQPVVRRYFTLAPEAPEPARVAVPPTLRVRELDCAAVYDQANVVFRVSPVEVRSYRYNNWSSEPGIMLAEVLRRYLAASGRFNLVDAEDPADLELGGRVDVIEQVVDDDGWSGRLELSLTLRRVRDGRVYWRQRIDGSRPAERQDVAEVVAAQSFILGTALAQEIDALSQAAQEAVAGPPAGSEEQPADASTSE
jgi:ABC-type uncharacterized transport system auxiliary subunit